MRIPPRPNRNNSLDGDTMTPMIDVVFLLLVFFICASVGSTADKLLPAELNGNSTSSNAAVASVEPETWEQPPVQIRIEPSIAGHNPIAVFLDEQPLSGIEVLSQRLTLLSRADPLTRIILNVNDDVEVQQFILIYDLCQKLKFENVSFAVRAQN
ncbi:MAG: biopolymer transporter ExbD [Planctomycetota bacterium]|nr:biopolymer transporter ExbD [Planctomycetales bacterium]RLT08409.1 MAG: biopolymer transporter ExbD [Planctomycetota bacterium]